MGPVTAQTTTIPAANKKATELPVAFVAHSANFSKKLFLSFAFLVLFRFAMAIIIIKPIYAKLIPDYAITLVVPPVSSDTSLGLFVFQSFWVKSGTSTDMERLATDFSLN